MPGTWIARDRQSTPVVKHRLRVGSLYSLGAVAYTTVALLALGKLLTNTLTPHAVGQVALTLLVAESLGMAAGMGLPAALPKLLAGLDAPRLSALTRRLGTIQFMAASHAAVLGLVALLLRPWWPTSAQDILPESLGLLFVLPLLVLMVAHRDFLLAATAGRQAYRARAGALVLLATLMVLQFALLYAGDIQQPTAFLGAHVLAGFVAILALRLALPKRIREESESATDEQATQKALRFAAPLYVNNLMNFVYQRCDTLVIVLWLDLGTAAIVEMAKRLPTLLSRLLGAGLVPYLPTLSAYLREDETIRARQLIAQTTAIVAFCGYAVTLFLTATAAPLLALLFTAHYQEGAAVLGLLLIATCLAVQAGIMGQALIARDRPKTVMVINLALGALSLGLNLLLVPRFGMVGAGWSAIVAAGASLLLQFNAVRRAGLISRPPALVLHGLFVLCLIGFQATGEAIAPRLLMGTAFVVLAFLTGNVSIGMLRREDTP